MASDTASGGGQGAAQGAATGAMLGPWGALIGAGVGAVSGWLGSKSSKKAADQQKKALEEAKLMQGQLRGDMQNRLTPYLGTGQTATDMLGQGLRDGSLTRSFTNEDFVKDPGYDWRMAEGTRAVEGGAAARGGLLSGAAAKALTKYGQGFASNEYQNAYNRFSQDQGNRYNRLLGAAGLGQNAVSQANAADQWYGGNMMNLQTGIGNAGAAGTMGSANAIAGGLSQAYNAYQDNALMRALQGGQGAGFSGGNMGSRPYTQRGQLYADAYGFGGGE